MKAGVVTLAPPIPRGPICAKMCRRCPFRPDGSGYAQGHPDLPRIVANVEAGLPFYCHETVILDPRTTIGDNGDPSPRFQPHFELCRGGHERHMAAWRARNEAAKAANTRPTKKPPRRKARR